MKNPDSSYSFLQMVMKQLLKSRNFHILLKLCCLKWLASLMEHMVQILCTNSESRVDYFSRKQKHTVNTQAVVGASLMFLHVATGYPGGLHEARILRVSSLFGKAERNEILAQPTRSIDGFNVRPLILSDSAYPSTMWQIKPFPFRQNLPQHQKVFN